jgi:hypothetical protein
MIYVISGKARNGKDTIALELKDIYEKKGKKVINLAYGSYIKEYAKKISNWDGSEETKPRELLQTLGTDIIRNQIDSEFFVKRICDDIRVYSNFFDVITISDARFPNELDTPKKLFKDVVIINVVRDNFDNPLSGKEMKHRSETALDDYKNYDFIVHNDGTINDLNVKIENIVKKVEHEY